MLIRGSFISNLEPSGKVMNLEVHSCNGILLIMNDGLKVGLLE